MDPFKKQSRLEDLQKNTISAPMQWHIAAAWQPETALDSGEVIEIDDFLDIGLHVADELELNIGLKQGASDLVDAPLQDLLVDYGRIDHLLESWSTEELDGNFKKIWRENLMK